MERDCMRYGALRAAQRWGIPAGYWLGDREAFRVVAQHPIFGQVLRHRHAHPTVGTGGGS
jgi:hypothetical protein